MENKIKDKVLAAVSVIASAVCEAIQKSSDIELPSGLPRRLRSSQ